MTVVNNLVFQHTQMHHQYTKHQKPSQKTYFKSLLKKYWLHHDSIEEAYLVPFLMKISLVLDTIFYRKTLELTKNFYQKLISPNVLI